MSQRRPGPIAFLVDDRLSRERKQILSRIIVRLKQTYEVEILNGQMSEEKFLEHLKDRQFKLILAPWYRYLSWRRVEAFYGNTRTSGPTFAGYFADPLMPFEVGQYADHLRAILLDFTNLNVHESTLLVHSLFNETHRSGIKPLIRDKTPIYCEEWFSSQGLGSRIDLVTNLPELKRPQWAKRQSAIRVCLSAFWALIYEEGPGKSELLEAIPTAQPRAYFQIAIDESHLIMRLCYSRSLWTPKSALEYFWPSEKTPCSAPQLLLRYADFVRAHVVPDTSDIEVVVGLFESGAADKYASQMHTLWVEPLATSVVVEAPFQAPGDEDGRFRALPALSKIEAAPAAVDTQAIEAKDRHIADLNVKLRKLVQQAQEKEEMIRELRSGGVGVAPSLPPPDPDVLLEAFQERFFDVKFQIRKIEHQIVAMEQGGAKSNEIETLKLKLQSLIQDEQRWLNMLSSTLEVFKSKKAAGSGG